MVNRMSPNPRALSANLVRVVARRRLAGVLTGMMCATIVAGAATVSAQQPPSVTAPASSMSAADAAVGSQAPAVSSSPAPTPAGSGQPGIVAPPADRVPAVHHAPVSTGEAHRPLRIRAEIDNPHLVRRAWVAWRPAGSSVIETIPFQRASDGPYVAVIPGDRVADPWLEYCIEFESVDGRTFSAFASRQAMFRVAVPGNLQDLRERAMATRVSGRRSVVDASGEFVYFGKTDAMVLDPATNRLVSEGIADRYWRTEAGYTYRPLGVVSEFSIRAGVVRGQSVVPDETDKSKFEVGLNYASPKVRLRAADDVFVDAELLTSVTEVGFSLGGGGALLIGDPYGTRMTFGFETVETFGTRFYTRMDISANDRFTVAPIIEVTDMPHADRYGVRLLTEVQLDAGQGFRLGLRGGYQARTYTSGGASVGTSVSYAF